MRLIDADALKEIISGNSYILRDSINSMNFGMFWDGIEQAIDESPTIDAEPVRHGHWIEDEIQIHIEKTYHCSECDCLAWGEDEKTRYCPICGARMDGEEDE